MPELCLLLAAERSGTHLLRSLLANVPGVKAPAEICNIASDGTLTAKKISFLDFRRRACQSDQCFFFPSQPVQTRLMDMYADFVRTENSGRDFIILDIKYSHVHNFNFFWWDMSTRPFLLQYAQQREIKIIHLIRRKVYRTAISHAYAKESGVWRARTQNELKAVEVTADRARLDQKARQIAQAIAFFERWLVACRHIVITYEDLIDDANISLKRLQEFLGLKCEIKNEPGFVKTTPPYEESIVNFGEIKDLIDVDWQEIKWAPHFVRV